VPANQALSWPAVFNGCGKRWTNKRGEEEKQPINSRYIIILTLSLHAKTRKPFILAI